MPENRRRMLVGIFSTALSIMFLLPMIIIAQGEVGVIQYKMPPEEIAELIDAPQTPSVYPDPSNEILLVLGNPNLPSIEELAQPEERLAGVRINPRTNGPSRQRYYNSLSLMEIGEQKETPITGLPENPQISNVNWSPDGERIAFTITSDSVVELWLAERKSAEAIKLIDLRLNDAYGSVFYWLPDSRTLLCKIVPEDRGEPPIASTLPEGPVVQENIGKTAPAATYADLLENPHDEALFEYYLQSELIRVDIEGEITPLGISGLFTRATPSPSGEYILVSTIHRPYSYLIPASRFPHRIEIWDIEGNLIRQVTDQPLAEEIPVVTGAVRTGPRQFSWRNDVPATLYWVEALDEGDPRNAVEVRDQLYYLPAPFDGNPIPFFALEMRYSGIMWGNDDMALISEWWWPTRWTKTWAFAPGSPDVEPELVFDRSWQDRYNDPGSPMMRHNEYGKNILLTVDNGTALLLTGGGASPEGSRPFLDKLNMINYETTRLWQSEDPYYEAVYDAINAPKMQFLTRRESVTEPPNYFVRDIDDDRLTQVTKFPHPTPQLIDVQKELITYERADGITLSAKLYLPAGYSVEDGPLPTIVWAYPREYKSADAAGQVTDSPYRFVRVGWWSPLLWLTRGYAVIDYPSMPILGEGEQEPNDTFIEQLVMSAKAAIDEGVKRGVTDPERVAIGGHSYGAFMTANLLAHSDLFAAGIARTGAYNRTLTPFGFQSEDRTFWEAPQVYFEMSPFMHADKVDEPILLIHGDTDNNPGTFPMQSERFFNALKGHGATARLVMLPYESHSYRARENVMHVLWETDQWLDTYVKNKSEVTATE